MHICDSIHILISVEKITFNICRLKSMEQPNEKNHKKVSISGAFVTIINHIINPRLLLLKYKPLQIRLRAQFITPII